jgi:hypothetical protein
MIAAAYLTGFGPARIPEVIVTQSFAIRSRAQHALFACFFRRLREKLAFSLEDSEDYTFSARMQSSEIFGFY